MIGTGMDSTLFSAAAGSTRRILPQTMTEDPQDSLFIALLNGFRRSGGLHRSTDLKAARGDAWYGEHIGQFYVAVSERRILGIVWNEELWMPEFQFGQDGMIKPVVTAVYLELVSICDPWELATWFVTPSGWLEQARPVDLIDSSPRLVVDAARADRFVATGN